jgi:L-lactate dehydrogenase complex protein LldG
VAENGAVWIDDRTLPARWLPFLAEHLLIVLPAVRLVDDMHAAYDRIARPLASYGVFVSGPSKTADIEQRLVVGAHGARSLTLIMTGQASY